MSLKALFHSLLLPILVAPITSFAADYQPALGMFRNCDFLNERYTQAYSKVADFKGTPESLGLWQWRYRDEYRAYLAFMARMKNGPGYKAIESTYGAKDADDYLQTCLRKSQPWKTLADRYARLPGMNDIVALNESLGAGWSAKLKTEINRQMATAAAEARKLSLEAMARSLTELSIRQRHYVTLEFRKHSHLDPLSNWTTNNWKAREQEIPVSAQGYQALGIGQELNSNFDWSAFISDGSTQSYKVIVSNKRQSMLYFVRTLEAPAPRAISQSEYGELVDVLTRLKIPVETSHFAGQSQVMPVNSAAVVKTEPAKRYFATLEIKNESTTLSLLKHLRNHWLSHEIELELTESDFNGGTVNFATGWQTSNVLLSGWLSEMTGQVIRQRVVVDPAFEKVTLSDGRVFYRATKR